MANLPPEATLPPDPVEAPGDDVSSPEPPHPALWRADQVGSHRRRCWPTGFVALDAVLPGGGWPTQALSELLLPHSGIGEMRLLAPALSALQRLGGRGVMLFDPPGTPCAWTLSALGIDLQQLVVVRSAAGVVGSARASSRRPPEADLLWALEHTLKSGQAGAVLAWLPPRLRAEPLRRLQLAAHAHEGPAFLMREIGCRDRPSASPLRLALAPASADELLISVFKRRGPPLQQPLLVELHPVLSDPEKRRARRLPPLEVEVAALSLPLRA